MHAHHAETKFERVHQQKFVYWGCIHIIWVIIDPTTEIFELFRYMYLTTKVLARRSNCAICPTSGVVKNVVLPALGAFAGNLAKNAVDEKPLDFGEAAQGALFNIIFQNLPTKYLGNKLNKGKSMHTWVLPFFGSSYISFNPMKLIWWVEEERFTGYALFLSNTKEVIWISKEM